MNIVLPKSWSVRQFLDWAESQEGRYEFDGIQPVAMTGGTANHNRITTNIHAALRSRLRGTGCSYFGPDLGIQTVGDRIRFPDALITCTDFPGTERLVHDVVIVFEVISSDSARRDRIEKVREYAAIPSIRRYIIVESATSGLLVLHRQGGTDSWTALTLTTEDTLSLPEVNIEIPVSEFYENVKFQD